MSSDECNESLQPSLVNLVNLINLIILPILNGWRLVHYFAALPLHYLARGWPLTSFGLTVAISAVVRSFFTSPMYGKNGPWFVVLVTLFHLCLSAPMVIWPSSFVAVTAGIFGCSALHFLYAYQTLTFSRFEDEHSRNLASRVTTLADTVGCGTAPLLSGVLYDVGGWRLCAIFQLACIITELVLLLSSSVIRADFHRWRCEQQKKKEVAVVPLAQEVSEDNSLLDDSQHSSCGCLNLPRAIVLPAVLITMWNGLNIFVYVIEWSVFAVYFRQVHNWTSAWWAGAAQMSGDVTGAFILLAVNNLKKDHEPDANGGCVLLRLFRPPYHLSLLQLSWVTCHFLMASDTFAVAVAAQVVMGTVFVFMSQFLMELSHLYSGGNFEVFLRMQSLSSTVFGMGVAGGTFFSTWAYTTYGPKGPFYLGAVVSLAGFLIYTAGFLLRVGLPRSLKAYEGEHYPVSPSKRQPISSAVVNVDPTECSDDCTGAAMKRSDGLRALQTKDQLALAKKEQSPHQMINMSGTLSSRVNDLLFDCGLPAQSSDDNIVSRGRRLASELGLPFASVLGVVDKAELLVYGSLTSVTTAMGSSKVAA